MNEPNAFYVSQRVTSEPVVDALKGRRLPQEEPAPFGTGDRIQGTLRLGLPVRGCCPAIPDGLVDMPIWL